MKKIIVLGATSAIAEATARLYAEQGHAILLVGRNTERLGVIAQDLAVRGAERALSLVVDLADDANKEERFAEMTKMLGGVDIVLMFYGLLGDQQEAEDNIDHARQITRVNYTSSAEWCLLAASYLEKNDSGTLCVVSSVAGDRGRKSNYIYGAAKSALTVLIQGIAHRLAAGNARAVAIKAGFVDTPMTAMLPRPGPFWTSPGRVAKIIVSAVKSGRSVVYAPWYWWWIMLVIKWLPDAIFKRTSL